MDMNALLADFAARGRTVTHCPTRRAYGSHAALRQPHATRLPLRSFWSMVR